MSSLIFNFSFLDNCQICTNGTTGLVSNYLVDCSGQCNTSFTDTCGNCQSKTNFVNFTDCAGVCNGLATINDCGICAGGSTGRPITAGTLSPCIHLPRRRHFCQQRLLILASNIWFNLGPPQKADQYSVKSAW